MRTLYLLTRPCPPVVRLSSPRNRFTHSNTPSGLVRFIFFPLRIYSHLGVLTDETTYSLTPLLFKVQSSLRNCYASQSHGINTHGIKSRIIPRRFYLLFWSLTLSYFGSRQVPVGNIHKLAGWLFGLSLPACFVWVHHVGDSWSSLLALTLPYRHSLSSL